MSDFLEDFEQKNKERCVTVFGMTLHDWSLAEWGNALAGETGELCNILKKVKRRDFSLKEAQAAIKEEVGGIATYLDLLCQASGLSLKDCIKDEFNRVSEKKGTTIKLE